MNFGRVVPAWVSQDIEFSRRIGRRISDDLLKPNALRWDAEATQAESWKPTELLKALNKEKMFSLWLPKFVGGGGLSPLGYLAMSEELARGCLGAANILGAHYVALSLLASTENLKLLRKIIRDINDGEESGEPCVLAAAITEPDAGSDLEDFTLMKKANVLTRSKRKDDGVLLTGAKQFISNAPYAKWFVVSAFEDLMYPTETTVLVAVPSDLPGLVVGRAERKMGQHICPAAPVFFDACQVPIQNVAIDPSKLSDKKNYLEFSENLLMDVLGFSRIGVAFMSMGVIDEVFDLTFIALKDGAPQSQKWLQSEWCQIQFALLHEKIEITRRALWDFAIEASLEGVNRDLFTNAFKNVDRSGVLRPLLPLIDATGSKRLERKNRALPKATRERLFGNSSIIKSAASDLAMETLDFAFRFLGPQACLKGSRLEKILRDSKLLQIYEGANSLNRLHTFNKHMGPKINFFKEFEDPIWRKGRNLEFTC